MKQKRPGYIFSIFDNDLTRDMNMVNHQEILQDLIKMKVGYKPIIIEREGNTVLGYYIQPGEVLSKKTIEQYVETRCLNTSNFYFSVSPHNPRKVTHVKLQSPSKRQFTSIGNLTCVDEREASDSYFHCPQTGTYFVTR